MLARWIVTLLCAGFSAMLPDVTVAVVEVAAIRVQGH